MCVWHFQSICFWMIITAFRFRFHSDSWLLEVQPIVYLSNTSREWFKYHNNIHVIHLKPADFVYLVTQAKLLFDCLGRNAPLWRHWFYHCSIVMWCIEKNLTILLAEKFIFVMYIHWGQVTHICVGNLTIIGPDNGLSPCRRQAII